MTHPLTVIAEPSTLRDADPFSADGVQVDVCQPLDRITFTTRNSSYEIVVVTPEKGDVLLRGGQRFPGFRPARLIGATSGGHTVKLHGIYSGLSVEFFVDHQSVVTSGVHDVKRIPSPKAAKRAQ